MRKEVLSSQWVSMALVFLAIAVVGLFLQPSIDPTGALVYRDYSYGGYGGYGSSYSGSSYGSFGYGGMTASAFYQEYSIYIDAIIFLIIFLSIGKAVFLDHFKAGGKSLYIALGLGLTLALMIWEEQRGFSIIYEAGIVSVIVIVAALLAATYYAIKKATGSDRWGFFAAFVVGFVLQLTFNIFDFIFESDLISKLSTEFSLAWQTNGGRFSIFFTIAVLIVLFTLGRKGYKKYFPD